MNEWKSIIVDELNKGVDVVQDLLIVGYNKFCMWYSENDNKKRLAGAVSSWLLTFVVIICICRISNVNDVAVSANETTTEELETTAETSEFNTVMVKNNNATQETTVSVIETTPETEQETSSEAEMTVIQEKETIDVSKISVSSTPIADDRNKGDNYASISSADVKTVSSTKYDSTQFSYGIDISYHQGKIDWDKVKAAGVEYAFIRVGNRGYETGKLCKDARFDENVKGALANGIQVGVYFFSQATTEAEALEEASLTLNWIKNYNITLPVVIDWETDVGYRTYSGLSKSKLTNIITVFCDTVSRYGYEPMVYMCKDDFINRINTTTISSKYKTWVAWYFKEYSSSNYSNNVFKYGNLLPDMTFDYNIWQYSCKGRINGIKELVDMNVMILPKKVYEVKLETSKDTFVTNVGKSIDLMEGVTASDSSGNSATSSINMTLYNSKGNQISKENAFATTGSYKIKYNFKDVNGTEVTKEAVLYVRNVPELYFDGTLWNTNETKEIEYKYNETLTENENYNAIAKIVNSKCSSYYYDTLVGLSSKHTISNITIQGMEDIIVNQTIDSKTVNVTYIAKDGLGLETTGRCYLIIKREHIDEETTGEETENEETNNTTDAAESTSSDTDFNY